MRVISSCGAARTILGLLLARGCSAQEECPWGLAPSATTLFRVALWPEALARLNATPVELCGSSALVLRKRAQRCLGESAALPPHARRCAAPTEPARASGPHAENVASRILQPRPDETAGVLDQTRNAGIECLLQAFIATKQRSGEAPRSKDELRSLIAGVSSWFFEGAMPKKGQEGHIFARGEIGSERAQVVL